MWRPSVQSWARGGPGAVRPNLKIEASGPIFVNVTKRIRVLFQGERPSHAPDVMWVDDSLDLEELANRVPGAVGYVDLDLREVEVRPGTLSDEELERQSSDLLR